ncbi:MAG: hypothetical protein ACOY3K_06055 [Candidatus Omnitrophota bacterium]
MKRIFGSLVFCLLWGTVAADLGAASDPSAALKELYPKALEALKARRYPEANALAGQLLRLDPQSEFPYQIIALSALRMWNFNSAIAIVEIARAQGVESAFLDKYQIYALYYAGGFTATLQGFRRIEDRAEKQGWQNAF